MPWASRFSPLPDQPYGGRTAENRGAGRSGKQARVLGHVLLPVRVIGGENDAARGDFWLIDRGDRLRPPQ
jgi:hypothetical protein